MGNIVAKSEKHTEAEAALPANLRETFNLLIDDYMDASETHTSDNSRRVNYNILADLVQAGWRKQ